MDSSPLKFGIYSAMLESMADWSKARRKDFIFSQEGHGSVLIATTVAVNRASFSRVGLDFSILSNGDRASGTRTAARVCYLPD